MEAQSLGNHASVFENQEQLVQAIISTYSGRTQEEVRRAEIAILQSFNVPGFIEQLSQMIVKQNNSLGNNAAKFQFKSAIAALIKSFSCEFAKKKSEDKSHFIMMLNMILMNDSIEFNIKQIIGAALLYQLKEDQSCQYKHNVKQSILELLSTQGVEKFDYCIIAANAFFNSLTETSHQIQHFMQLLQPISFCALQICHFIQKMPLEEWLIRCRLIMPKISKLFQFLMMIIEGIMEAQQQYQTQVKLIKQNKGLITIIQSYMLLFSNQKSMVSVSFPQINDLKGVIMDIATLLYQYDACPERMFHIIYITFLIECKQIINDFEKEKIIILCINILQAHLENRVYLQLFHTHKLQTVFALFMYSATNDEETEMIMDDPMRFVQLSQEYTECSVKSTFLKVKAACFLKIFVQRIDQALKTILQILMVIISGSLDVSNQDSQLMQAMKQKLYNIRSQFSKFKFYCLDSNQKLQISLMVLSALSGFITRRPDLNKVIYAFFLTQFQSLVKITDQLVILRIIRSVSYFPTSLYFLYIQSQMQKGQVFIIQGIKAFERILKTNKFSQLFQFLSNIFVKIITVIKIQDPIMELIIVKFYDKIIRVNRELYKACLNKIITQLYQNMEKNQQATSVSFNLLYALLKKQQDPKNIEQIQLAFYDISSFLQNNTSAELYNKYEDKLIEIFEVIMTKHPNVSIQIETFAQTSLKYLHHQQKGTLFFRFYNTFIIKLDGASFKLRPYFNAFWDQIKKRYELFLVNKGSLQTIPYYCFLVSEIIVIDGSILDGATEVEVKLKELMIIFDKVPYQFKQYPVIILLTFLYMQPYSLVSFLKQYNLYHSFLEAVDKMKFQGLILKKIHNLAFIKLLEIQQDPPLVRNIFIKCINCLKDQCKKYRKDIEKKPFEVRPRRFGQDRTKPQQQQMQAQQSNDNDLINIFCKFKHPFQTYSEYDQFKIKYWHNDQLLKQLDSQTVENLRMIMETEIVENNKTRIIRRVKK